MRTNNAPRSERKGKSLSAPVAEVWLFFFDFCGLNIFFLIFYGLLVLLGAIEVGARAVERRTIKGYVHVAVVNSFWMKIVKCSKSGVRC